MNRNLHLAALALSIIAGCDDKITQPGMFSSGAQADGGGDGGTKVHTVPAPTCGTAACCPTDPSCSPTPKEYSGPECLAQFDNSPPENRWQLRQTWNANTLPLGNAGNPIGPILMTRAELNWPACNASDGVSGFIQLVDFDLTANTGRVGFAKYVAAADVPNAVANGLCMVEDQYDDTAAHTGLPTGAHLTVNMVTDPSTWPAGLPQPMMLPWNAAPTNAKGVLQDFDYATQRKDILAKFAPGGEYANYTGIFYLNRKTGFLHGFAPVAYVVVYDTATQLNIIPIRESEITAQLNDPEHPNCVGIYRADALSTSNNCKGSLDVPAWGCPNDECPVGQGPNVTKGYFLITELEQVYNSVLQQTICNVDSGPAGAYGSDPKPANACRQWPNWDPTKPATGLPRGDWCAETNGPSNDTCHDAFRNISYATFQGFRIQANTCTK